jgi:hypothetical protein
MSRTNPFQIVKYVYSNRITYVPGPITCLFKFFVQYCPWVVKPGAYQGFVVSDIRQVGYQLSRSTKWDVVLRSPFKVKTQYGTCPVFEILFALGSKDAISIG